MKTHSLKGSIIQMGNSANGPGVSYSTDKSIKLGGVRRTRVRCGLTKEGGYTEEQLSVYEIPQLYVDECSQ